MTADLGRGYSGCTPAGSSFARNRGLCVGVYRGALLFKAGGRVTEVEVEDAVVHLQLTRRLDVQGC